jgi:predicted phage tail protein
MFGMDAHSDADLAGSPPPPADVRETPRPRSARRWFDAVVCIVVAFLLMAPLPTALAWGSSLGLTPGAFLAGASFLVMGVVFILEPSARTRQLDRIRKWLLVAGIALALLGAFIW